MYVNEGRIHDGHAYTDNPAWMVIRDQGLERMSHRRPGLE